MKKSSRYLLISLGIAIFFVIAPLLILYVSGTSVDIDNRDASSTGILDVKSEPSNATVTINEEKKDSTPATIRFLAQGEYVVKISKDGYHDWVKRLPIEAGEVRFAQEGVEVVQLIKKSVPIAIEPSNVSNFLLVDGTIWYMQGNNIVYASVNNPSEKTVIPNSISATNPLLRLRDHKHIAIAGSKETVLINSQAKSISALPFAITNDWQIQVPSDDTILYYKDGRIFSYNLIAKNSLEVKAGINAFTFNDGTGYFARTNGVISSAVWNGASFIDEQVISENVNFDKTKIGLIITDRKELFLNNGPDGFYRVSSTLDKISPAVDEVTLDPITNELTLRTSGELWFYNFLTNKSQLLTRSTDQVSSFLIHSSIGYGFVGSNNGLEVVEIDARDQQNRYQLLSGKPVYQIAITENQKTVLALQDGALMMIELRD